VNSRQDCLHQCSIEESFVCRSVLFKPDTRPGKALCVLYHLDHTAFPGGADDLTTASPQPVIGGERSRFYLETVCGAGGWESALTCILPFVCRTVLGEHGHSAFFFSISFSLQQSDRYVFSDTKRQTGF
ncbi:hypothetical protein AVEN_195191-1, partial [Araneus ventricosus]